MPTRRDVLLPVTPNPMEVYLLVLCAFSGGTGLIRLAGGVRSVQPVWLDAGWYLLLLAGGVTAVAGLYWRDTLVGMLVVRAAMWPVGAGAAMYAAGQGFAGRWAQAVVVAAFGVAAVLRAAAIGRQLRYGVVGRRR